MVQVSGGSSGSVRFSGPCRLVVTRVYMTVAAGTLESVALVGSRLCVRGSRVHAPHAWMICLHASYTGVHIGCLHAAHFSAVIDSKSVTGASSGTFHVSYGALASHFV